MVNLERKGIPNGRAVDEGGVMPASNESPKGVAALRRPYASIPAPAGMSTPDGSTTRPAIHGTNEVNTK